MCAEESQAARIRSHRLRLRLRKTQGAVLTVSAAQLRARLVLANVRAPVSVGLVVSRVRTQTRSSRQVMEAAATSEFEESLMRQEFGIACDVCERLWFRRDLKSPKASHVDTLRTLRSSLGETKLCATRSKSLLTLDKRS